MWDVPKEVPLKAFIGSEELESVHSLAFSSDGSLLANVCSNSTIYLWKVDTGTHVKTLNSHTRAISNLCFSPDGNTLASGCDDGTVLLWDMDSTGGEMALINNNPFIISESNIDRASGETIRPEGNSEFQNRASQIQQFCVERDITLLCHFTRIENLHSILQQGLLGRNLLETRRQQFLFNDHDRVDGHKEAICLSISFPNYQMFYSIREEKKETQEANDSQWVVLLLDAKVLWELE